MKDYEVYDKFFADEEYELENAPAELYSYRSGWNTALKRASIVIHNEIRPQGEWIGSTDYDNTCKCSICRMTFDTDRLKMIMCEGEYELPPCCPHCGAKLKGGKEE